MARLPSLPVGRRGSREPARAEVEARPNRVRQDGRCRTHQPEPASAAYEGGLRMTPLPENGGTIVPCLHIGLPEGFEVCWAGPNPLGDGFCFGSTDGRLLFTDDEGRPLPVLQP